VPVLDDLLGEGDFLLNLSVNVSSLALIAYCQARGVLYPDTCLEPWAGGYTERKKTPAERTNCALRETALSLRSAGPGQATAVITHGANPGLVSHLLKQALLDLAQISQPPSEAQSPAPGNRKGWARLAQTLGIRVVHIAERDTQVGAQRKALGAFVNTWSVEGFHGEGCQPAELGWGSHERHFPADGRRHTEGCRAAIYLDRPGARTQVCSWTPLAGPQQAFLITHGESISIADYLTLGDPDQTDYRPTVHYAYHPCDDAVLSLHELAGRNWRLQAQRRLLRDDIVSGTDALGVLLMGHAGGAYGYGSCLTIEQVRASAEFNSATTLQVTAAVMAGVVWAMQHPKQGLTEPEDMPFAEVLALCRPYLGEVVGVFSDWTPLDGRGALFSEPLDRDDPWQFVNFRVF